MRRRIRLDHLLVERGLAENGSQAQAVILAGQVTVDGQVASKPGAQVPLDARLVLLARPQFASRGGLKLAAALDVFQVSAAGLVCADVGASTGGFTDCLLQRGATRVYAIDVGYGQLAWRLRQDARVKVMERTNARYLAALPEPVQLVTLDASFISLGLLLPTVVRWLAAGAHVLPLVKPQFEAGRDQVGKGGVVRDPAIHREVLARVAGYARDCGMAAWGVMRSPIFGPAGNAEFMMHLRPQPPPASFDLAASIERCLGGAPP